jgi:hypothetical protein
MKIFMTCLALLWLIACPVALADEDPFRAADITDTSGTRTHVLGLHYCHEETEGDSLYINKYDEFFVQRGEALIRVLFKDLSRVVFTGPMEERGDKRVRKARIFTRSGNEVEAEILCHSGSFIQGRTPLGQFSLDMDKIREMVFPTDVSEGKKSLALHLLDSREPPEKALRLALSEAGILGLAEEAGALEGKNLEKQISSRRGIVILEIAEALPYRILAEKLREVDELGARHLYLAP